MALNTVSSDRLSTNVKTSNLGTELKGKIGENKNLIINGAMNVAQYGSSSTDDGYNTCDRFRLDFTGTNENPTQAQSDVVSSDSGDNPFAKGITRCMKITNGNQTGGADAGDYMYIRTKLEAQDIRNSGWNYNSTSSYITLSFYVKSSVAQNFYGYVRTYDGTNYHYPFETGSLTVNTWTKVTKTIPGNSNLQFDNNTSQGFDFTFLMLFGTSHTSSSASLNQWQATGSGDAYTPDNTTTWYTTNDATLEFTGVQLEVGSVATDFEHKSYEDELRRCQRYFYPYLRGTYAYENISLGYNYNGSAGMTLLMPPVEMRASPTLETS